MYFIVLKKKIKKKKKRNLSMWDIILIQIWNDEIGWEHWGSVGVVHTACKGACIWHNVKM